MGQIRFSFLIVGFALLLTTTSESAAIKSEQVRTNEHQTSAENIQKTPSDHPETSSQFQIELLETLRTISNQQKAAYEQNDASNKTWNTPAVLVQIGLLIVGAVYSVFASLQWCAIRRQTDIMVASERAWVGICFKRPYTLGGDFIDVEIFNSGKTPGHIKAVKVDGLEPVQKEPPIRYEPKSASSEDAKATWTIFPNESTIQRWVVKLGQGEVIDIANETKRLPLFGFVLYEDVFGKVHVTNFCREFMQDGNDPMIGKFMIPYDALPGQNEAT